MINMELNQISAAWRKLVDGPPGKGLQWDFSSHRRYIVALIVLLAIVFRLAYWYGVDPIIDRDSVLYCKVAGEWHQTGNPELAFRGYIGNTPPGYIFLLKTGLDLGVPVLLWGRVVGLACSVLLLMPLYLIGRFFDRRWGGEVVLVAAALHPYFVRDAVTLLREVPCLLVYAWGIYALCRVYQSLQWQWAVVVGVCSGIGFLLRYEAVELLLLLVLVCIMPSHEKRKNKWLVLLYSQACAVCAFVLTVFAWGMISGCTVSSLFEKFHSKLNIFV